MKNFEGVFPFLIFHLTFFIFYYSLGLTVEVRLVGLKN
jgi:hypothetical protein